MLRYLTPIAAAATLLPAPLSAKVVEESDNGFATRDTALVAASPYEAWQALIAPGTWWNDGHTWSGDAENMYISAQANGCFCELLPELEDAPQGVRRGSSRHMTVVQADPPRVLRMRGGLGPLQSEPVDGVLTVTISEIDDGTLIVWEYVVGGYFRYEVPVIAKAVDGVMSQQLAGLAKLLGPVETEQAGEAGGEEDAAEEAAKEADEPAPGDADDGEEAKKPAEEAPKITVDEAFGDLVDDDE